MKFYGYMGMAKDESIVDFGTDTDPAWIQDQSSRIHFFPFPTWR